jgi:hypothetical protein
MNKVLSQSAIPPTRLVNCQYIFGSAVSVAHKFPFYARPCRAELAVVNSAFLSWGYAPGAAGLSPYARDASFADFNAYSNAGGRGIAIFRCPNS